MKGRGGNIIVEKNIIKEELKITNCEGVLNIQLLVVRSPSHSSSSLECVEGKAYNKNIQFV
jgi:hypothetical protein